MLDLYADKGRALPQKLTLTAIEFALIALSFFILFGGGDQLLFSAFGWPEPQAVNERRWVIFTFNAIILARMALMMFVFLKRRIPWQEVFSVPTAFALYYVGFAILVLPNPNPLGLIDWIGIALFALGCVLNTGSEWQRHIFKADPNNKGKLFTGGMFKLSMHINFFGDVVWVFAYALIAMHWVGFLIPLMLLAMFMFFNVPKLDDYLRERYGASFVAYEGKTKRLIPFVW
jgi:protein-S-isoprenylcysteine O-methyltransferase Ste14